MIKGAFQYVIKNAFTRVFGDAISGSGSPAGLYVDSGYVDPDYVE